MKRDVLKLVLFSIISTLLASTGLVAQQVYWSPASGTLQQGKTNRIQLNFEGCSPDGNVTLPDVPNAELSHVGQSSSMNIFNSRVVQKLILEFQVSPLSEDPVDIPAFTAKTDKGDLPVNAVSYEVVEATVGNTGMKPEDILKSELSVVEESIYEGQIFTLRYVIGVRDDYRTRLNDISTAQWNPVGIVTKGFETSRMTNFTHSGRSYAASLSEASAMATRNGVLKLPKVNQTVSMVVGRRRGFIFDDPVVDNYNIASNTLELNIKPLPTGAPPSFNGAVGQFEFESTIVPEIVQVGEPVTWTLTLSGTGNWPQGIGISPRSVSASFRSIQPDVNKELSEDSPFEGSLTEDIVLIPTKDGDFSFGPIEFTYFNPKTDRYETINIPERSIVVNPMVATAQPDLPQSVSAAPLETNETPTGPLEIELDPRGINLLSKPVELLSEPSAAIGLASIPRGSIQLWQLAYSFAAPCLLWILIALIRAILFDPNKERRQAYKSLRAAALQIDDSVEQARVVQLSWREAAKRYWGIEAEEPSPDDVKNAVSLESDDDQAARWQSLWHVSDRILFGKRPPSFKDWQSDLRDALEFVRQPGLSFNRLFSTKAWFAVAAFGVVLFALANGNAQEGLERYNEGVFDEAQSTWTANLAQRPSDWALRHNIGLAAAQQESWGEAMAYWTSAFLLNPRSPELNWNLKVGLNKSGSYYPTLGRLVKGDGYMAYIALRSPAQWEQLAYLAMRIAGAAFCVWVGLAYFPRLKRLQFAALLVGVVSVASVFGADWARREYGLLANPQTLVATTEDRLKSIPTDLEVEQIESPLPEGSICLARKRFLGWIKVELPNGELGWARQERFASLYGTLEETLSRLPR